MQAERFSALAPGHRVVVSFGQHGTQWALVVGHPRVLPNGHARIKVRPWNAAKGAFYRGTRDVWPAKVISRAVGNEGIFMVE